MENKNWTLIFSALCLALVFSVSPVEAQKSCDADFDLYVKDTKKCRNLLTQPNTVYLGIDCDDNFTDPENDCGGSEPPADDNIYDVTMTGDLFFIPPFADDGYPDPGQVYVGSDGGGRSKPVNLGFQGITLDMSFFFENTQFGAKGITCFTAAPVDGMNTIAITISKEKDGTPSLRYWFTGHGDDGTEVNYLLELFREDDETFEGDWRPAPGPEPDNTTTAEFTNWDMSMNSGGNKAFACTGNGGVDVTVKVMNTSPE